MPRTAVALLAIALLVSGCQWCWLRLATHIDPLHIPTHSRRRVVWLTAHCRHVQLASIGVGLAALAVALLQ